MPYVAPIRPPVSRRLRGMRGLGQAMPVAPIISAPPSPIPPGPPVGWETGYPTTGEIPASSFPAAPGVVAIPSASAPSASSASALQVGTILTYQAQISLGVLDWTLSTASAVTTGVSGKLASKWGIDVIGVKVPNAISDFVPGATLSVTLVVQLRNAYGQADDVKRNIDHEFINTGVNLLSSSISVGGKPGSPPGSWLTDNWPWLAIGGAGLLVFLKVL